MHGTNCAPLGRKLYNYFLDAAICPPFSQINCPEMRENGFIFTSGKGLSQLDITSTLSPGFPARVKQRLSTVLEVAIIDRRIRNSLRLAAIGQFARHHWSDLPVRDTVYHTGGRGWRGRVERIGFS